MLLGVKGFQVERIADPTEGAKRGDGLFGAHSKGLPVQRLWSMGAEI